MKNSLLLLLSLVVISYNYGQSIDQISVGASYSTQTFYDIESGDTFSIDGESWDLSFSVLGFQDAAISINEGTSSMGTELELYYLGERDFDSEVEMSELTERIYNNEKSWLSGAFNSSSDPLNPTDYGWGSYNPGSMAVTGNKLFVIKLRDGELKKIFIESLTGTTYNLRYANLDGTDAKTVSIDKTDFQGKQRAFFKFETESVLNLEPDNWDLLFTRYSNPVDDGEGNILNYVVTGVLSSEGVKVAQVDEINPETVKESDYLDQYSASTDIIGYDWKSIDIATFQWSIITDRVYFVKTLEGNTYKIYFLDFEGSSTGVTTIQKTEVLSTSISEETLIDNVSIYPNPSAGNFSIDADGYFGDECLISIYNLAGQLMYQNTIDGNILVGGFNVITDLASGNYFLHLKSNTNAMIQKISIH